MILSCVHLLLLISCVAGAPQEQPRILNLLFGGNDECNADEKQPWSYRGKNAAKFWGEINEDCNGKEQSPIAISSRTVVPDNGLSRLALHNYEVPVSRSTIENNGHTVQVTPNDGVQRSIFVNGSTYNLLQMHFHWGYTPYEGSEHTINGIRLPLELHLVHQNKDKKLAVVGVLFVEQRNNSAEMQKIVKAFPRVMYQGNKSELTSKLVLNKLVPQNPASFYRYKGSLTTPGCSEGVTWSVLTDMLPVGTQQMEEFRKLYSSTKAEANSKCKLSGNYRPVQPLNDRKVYISQ